MPWSKELLRRIQRRRLKGWRAPARTRYCGRPGRYANPFLVGPHRTAAEAVASYRQALERGELAYSKGELREELRSYDFASCWCKDGDPCHVDVIVEVVNEKQLEKATTRLSIS